MYFFSFLLEDLLSIDFDLTILVKNISIAHRMTNGARAAIELKNRNFST